MTTLTILIVYGAKSSLIHHHPTPDKVYHRFCWADPTTDLLVSIYILIVKCCRRERTPCSPLFLSSPAESCPLLSTFDSSAVWRVDHPSICVKIYFYSGRLHPRLQHVHNQRPQYDISKARLINYLYIINWRTALYRRPNWTVIEGLEMLPVDEYDCLHHNPSDEHIEAVGKQESAIWYRIRRGENYSFREIDFSACDLDSNFLILCWVYFCSKRRSVLLLVWSIIA